MGTTSEKRVFLDIAVDSKPIGRIEIRLFTDDAPKTCENFRALCTGEVGMAPNNKARLHYKGNQIHRVVKKFMIQGGDITEGDGRGGYSIYGRYFDDEKFTLKHSKPYLVSMANKGANSNSSQFFITTAAAPHCNGKHVVFGEVIRGHQVVDLIENLEVDSGSKPNASVEISNCGELIKKQKKPDADEELTKQGTNKNDEKNNIPEGPKSWLYRPDESDDKNNKKTVEKKASYSRGDDRKHDRKHHRKDRRRRSLTRSRSRESRHDNDRYDRRDRKRNETGIHVRGRGGVRFRKERSLTPDHWKRNAPKKYVPAKSNSQDRENKYIEEMH